MSLCEWRHSWKTLHPGPTSGPGCMRERELSGLLLEADLHDTALGAMVGDAADDALEADGLVLLGLLLGETAELVGAAGTGLDVTDLVEGLLGVVALEQLDLEALDAGGTVGHLALDRELLTLRDLRLARRGRHL